MKIIFPPCKLPPLSYLSIIGDGLFATVYAENDFVGRGSQPTRPPRTEPLLGWLRPQYNYDSKQAIRNLLHIFRKFSQRSALETIQKRFGTV